MATNTITISGVTGREPKTGTTRSGDPYASISVAHTPRRYDPQTKEWVTVGETLWLEVTAYRFIAEQIAALTKGVPVVVTGKAGASKWTGRDGQERTSFTVTAEAVMPLRRTNSGSQQQQQQQAASAPATTPANNPWAGDTNNDLWANDTTPPF